MNGARAVGKYTVAEAAARGVCPVCTVLRQRQTRLIEQTGIPSAKHLCNHHAWALAKAAPGPIAAGLLLETLRTRKSEGTAGTPCDFCETLHEDEAEKLTELAARMQTGSFLGWMRLNGTLCLRHAHKIDHQLSPEGRKVVAEVVARTWQELEEALANYAEHAGRGEHAGGGVLGRAAEFLVCQRGIPGEETLC